MEPTGGDSGEEPVDNSHPTQPQCDLKFFTRPITALAGLAGLVGSHQYLDLQDDGSNTIVEGQWDKASNLLKASVDPLGHGLAANNPATDAQFGATLLIPCGTIGTVVATAESFTPTTYSALGPNSNSFMYWLLNSTGLLKYFPTGPYGDAGWGAPIPGNP
jgi:hypothetical protein